MGFNSKTYHKVVDHFLETKELSVWDDRNNSISLYDIENKPEIIERIRSDVRKITPKFNLVVLDKQDPYTNINILDIDI